MYALTIYSTCLRRDRVFIGIFFVMPLGRVQVIIPTAHYSIKVSLPLGIEEKQQVLR
jgi:hypothetical protein